MGTVRDANAQETSTILAISTKKAKLDGAAPSTPPVLRKSFSSKRCGVVAVCGRAQTDVAKHFQTFEGRSLRVQGRQAQAHAMGPGAGVPKCESSWAPSTRSAGCLAPTYWRHWDDVVHKRVPTDHGEKPTSVLSYAIWTKVPCTSLTLEPYKSSIDSGSIGL